MAQFPAGGIWKLREHAHRVQGDITYPNSSEASSVWSLAEIARATSQSNIPNTGQPTPPGGTLYADNYVLTTGGTITTFGSTSGSIDTAVTNLSDGDVLLLEPGSYTLTAATSESYSSDPWRNKNVLIAGTSGNANDVVIELTHASQRGKHIFAEGDGSGNRTPTINKQMAFVRLKRLATSDINYVNALAGGVAAREGKGRMVNCILDLNNGNVGWMYDNGNSTGFDVKFIRTTFLNYNVWNGSYNGALGILVVNNCLFTGSTQASDRATLTDCVTGATVQVSDGSYDTGAYPTAGHLYSPNLEAVF